MSLARRVRAWAGGVGLWAKNGDRAGGRGARLGYRDLSRVDRRAAFRSASPRRAVLLNLDLVLLLTLARWSSSASLRSGPSAAEVSPVRGCRYGWSGCSV